MPSDTDINANRGSWIIATGVTVCVLAVLALTARLLARRLVKCPYNASDYTLFLGWAFSCVTAGAIFDGKYVVLRDFEYIQNNRLWQRSIGAWVGMQRRSQTLRKPIWRFQRYTSGLVDIILY